MSNSISAVSAVSGAPAAATDTKTSAGPANALGQDAFMKLLVIQLQHQDPTAPKDDSQLLAQLAQFSSLEKLSSIDQTLAQLTSLFTSLSSQKESV